MNKKFTEKDFNCLEKHIGDMVICNVSMITNDKESSKSYQGYLYDVKEDCVCIGENLCYCDSEVSYINDIYSSSESKEIYNREPVKTLKKELK